MRIITESTTAPGSKNKMPVPEICDAFQHSHDSVIYHILILRLAHSLLAM